MQSRDESRRSPIILPTASNELTTTQEDLLLANHYFERIGSRQRIHEYAIYCHLTQMNKDSLARIISTFETLNCTQMQTPPPILPKNVPFNAKDAIARGRALAFSEGTPEADHAWAYGYTNSEGAEARSSESNPNFAATGVEDQNDPTRTIDEAELAFKNVEALVNCLRARYECQHTA
ncbi:hypothetical protein C8F04DRAFT_1265540 [Mycena alexandri]|uniref:Uncharacterized protein n=1 Tax=Mycena alexandri TaxID=1745969 RepID=A0AAD6SL92_9AGAR|nr:hypothetical protein C8F04DRAFT_1265540 [Mycena alexandri]